MIDISTLTSAMTSLRAAKDILGTLIGMRDFGKTATVVAQLNGELLKAQESLFDHQGRLFALQQEIFETREELRKVKETLAERGKYSLFEIGEGTFVYRSRADFAPEASGAGFPLVSEPEHYICQPCFDNRGFKAVLMNAGQRPLVGIGKVNVFVCPECKTNIWGI